jgi:hypothetical protein
MPDWIWIAAYMITTTIWIIRLESRVFTLETNKRSR